MYKRYESEKDEKFLLTSAGENGSLLKQVVSPRLYVFLRFNVLTADKSKVEKIVK